jgi:hypothetical protein
VLNRDDLLTLSVSKIAAQNGYANPGCIRLEFPDLCRAIGQKIAQRKRTEMNGKGEILKGALEEDPPLTAEQMAEWLGCGCPGVLRRNFPAEYKALLGKRMLTRRPKESSYVLT